jgi:putative membrane protein
MAKDRTLVLCVDRDDDLGFKGRIDGPVLGREACLQAANALGLIDPEDSDVNAIFETIKIFDELHEREEDVAIAVISGNHMNMLEGDRRIASHLDAILDKTGANSCILVTDGAEDEYVLPIIQSRVPVSSIRRVVVNQMPNLEGTYYILKRLLDDPKISKIVLVPLGLAMLLYAAAYLLGYPEGATIVVVGVVGTYLLFKGFGIDEIFNYFVSSLRTSLQGGRFTFVSYIAAMLLIAVGIIMGLSSLLVYYTSSGIFFQILAFIYGAIVWFTAAGMVAAVGKIIDLFLNERESIRRMVALPFFVLAIGAIAYGASIYILSISDIPQFPVGSDSGVKYIIFATIGGLFCAFFGVYLQSLLGRWWGGERETVALKREV